MSLELDQLSLSDVDPLPDNIILPPGLVSALSQAISPEAFVEGLRLVVADTGATDRMVPDCLAFISYKAIGNLRVCMGNNTFAPVLGWGTAIILLNVQRILTRHVLHVLVLRVLLYSLRAHLRQQGCGFVGSHDMGMHVYFPGFVLNVDTSTDCHLTYQPLDKSAPLSTLHYVQPHCPPTTYPDENSVFHATTISPAPVLVKNDDRLVALAPDPPQWGVLPAVESPSFKSVVPKRGPVLKAPLFWLTTLHQSLNTSSFCGIICLGWLVLRPLSRLLWHPNLWLLSSSCLCPLMRWSKLSILLVLCLHRSVPAIVPTALTRRCIGLQRSSTVLLGVTGSANYRHIIQTSLDGK